MGILSNLLNRLKNRVNQINQVNIQSQPLVFGCIYKMDYRNWKRDPSPLIWVQYSDQNYTHGININYLDQFEKQWLGQTIYMIKENNMQINGFGFYRLLKLNKISIVKKAYRKYKTGLIANPKMVSSGITYLNKLIVPFNDNWIFMLNKMLQPSGFLRQRNQPQNLTMSREDLGNRIQEAYSATPLSKTTVATRSATTGGLNA